jgi:hypothetical protein
VNGGSSFCVRIAGGVTDQSQQNISGVVAAWNGGDPDALDGLVALVYPQLRRIARQHLERRRGESIESAALANETYLKLERAGRMREPDSFPRALLSNHTPYPGGLRAAAVTPNAAAMPSACRWMRCS